MHRLPHQLTPIQRELLSLIALPQVCHWPDVWQSENNREAAVAWGLHRIGLIEVVERVPRGYRATFQGELIARPLLIARQILLAETFAADQRLVAEANG